MYGTKNSQRRFFLMLLFVAFVINTCAHSETFAQQGRRIRNAAFEVPAGLRPRVNFWIDVFTKYGKNHLVIHHREFPQIVFNVLDFTQEARYLNPLELEGVRKRTEQSAIERVKTILEDLANGQNEVSPFHKYIENQMRFLGTGPEKYRRVLELDLVRTQTGIREKYGDAIRRSGRYLPAMERIFASDYGLPHELTRLPFIESSFDYTAYSSVGAAGIWQFMPATARGFMTINRYVDERRDPIIATRGAARYLQRAYATLRSWPLAITSYNHGVAGVARKVRELGTTDIVKIVEHRTIRPFGFASNNFYPEFLAAVEVYEERERYFPEIQQEPAQRFQEVTLAYPMSIRAIATRFGVGLDALRQTNYALSDSVWSGKLALPAGYRVKIPQGGGIQIVSSVKTDDFPPETAPSVSAFYPNTLRYKVRPGDTLSSIARKHGLSIAEIRNLNKSVGGEVKVGQSLTLRSKSQPDSHRAAGAETVENSEVATVSGPFHAEAHPSKPKTVIHRIKKGQTLGSIAKTYRVSVNALKSANGLRGTTVRTGQTLRIPGPSIDEVGSPITKTGAERSNPTKTTVSKAKPSKPAAVSTYKVKSGDTLWSVSKRFGISGDQLIRRNRLSNSKIKPGQVLKIN